MKNILQIINKLRSLSGNAQLDYLEEHRDNALLKKVLLYTYDSNKKYKIDEAKYNKIGFRSSGDTEFDDSHWDVFFEMLDVYAESKGVPDTGVLAIKTLITLFSPEIEDLLKCILFKDLRINMGIKKFQKVWNDFCFTYPYMGAKPYSAKNLEKITFPCIVQTKMDGLFCNLIVDFDNKTVEYVSRQGKPLNIQGSLDSVFKEFDKLSGKYVFNGEVLVYDESTNRPYPREISNGIIRRDSKTQEELDAIRFVCWDYIPWDKFLAHKWNVPYENRNADLFLYAHCVDNPKFTKVHTEYANNLDEVYKIYNEQYSKGEEGVVVKNKDQIWKDGKPSGQVKIKAEKECDLQMTEFIEGKGAYKGLCGSIRCVTSDGKLEVYVKPRTPQDADYIWKNQDICLNKILAVKYNTLIQANGKDTMSLFLPRFVEIRDDKSVADTLDILTVD